MNIVLLSSLHISYSNCHNLLPDKDLKRLSFLSSIRLFSGRQNPAVRNRNSLVRRHSVGRRQRPPELRSHPGPDQRKRPLHHRLVQAGRGNYRARNDSSPSPLLADVHGQVGLAEPDEAAGRRVGVERKRPIVRSQPPRQGSTFAGI